MIARFDQTIPDLRPGLWVSESASGSESGSGSDLYLEPGPDLDLGLDQGLDPDLDLVLELLAKIMQYCTAVCNCARHYATAHNGVQHLAVSCANIVQHCATLDADIDPKSILGEAPGYPNSIQNRP